MRLFSFASLRVSLLLVALAFAAFYTLHQYQFSRAWHKTLQIVVFPINGDGREATSRYISSLRSKDFSPIDAWTQREAARYHLLIERPTQFTLGAEVHEQPPILTDAANPWASLWWGLKLRWWAFLHTPDSASNLERVRLFVIYQQGEKNQALPHSLGLQKGLLGVVYAYADTRQAPQNNILIAHELLHTVGAIDKYGHNGLPVFPHGYAEPQRSPLYPQRRAEIMAGHIPLSRRRSVMADSLRRVIINPLTAQEINWIEAPEAHLPGSQKITLSAGLPNPY